jgi:hypothetical protein
VAKTLSWFAALVFSFTALGAEESTPRWFKGNTHTHTTESDGDASPTQVVRWYREHGYDFLVITDHDKVTRLEAPGILLIPGEEVTDRLPKKSLHINAIGIERVVKPQRGASIVEVLQRNIDAVREAGGIAAVNHPNFGWSFGAEELKKLDRATLLEIASGHPLVNMEGGGGVPSVEAMWDEVLTSGKRIFAIAVDDAHHYQCDLPKLPVLPALPGQGWIVVRGNTLTRATIVGAIERGEFYASTGVDIDDYSWTDEVFTVVIREARLAKFRTDFIGRGGKVLHTSTSNPAIYLSRGNEGYIRARVTDSNGKRAWLQPVWIRR